MIDQHKPRLSRTSYSSTLQRGTIGVKAVMKQMANVCPRHAAADRPAAKYSPDDM